MPAHDKTKELFITDIKKCLEIVKANPTKFANDSAAM